MAILEVICGTLGLYLSIIICSGNLASDIALKAVKTVLREENDKKEIDIKNYAKVEKVSMLYLTFKMLAELMHVQELEQIQSIFIFEYLILPDSWRHFGRVMCFIWYYVK
jgi:hypothetical protein